MGGIPNNRERRTRNISRDWSQLDLRPHPAYSCYGRMSDKLKIGLIVDGERVSKYVYELADWANTTDVVCISHLIIQELPANQRGSILTSLFRTSPIKHAAVALWKVKTRLELRRVAAVQAYRG